MYSFDKHITLPNTGSKKDTWFAIDPLTGSRIQTLTVDSAKNVCPSGGHSAIFIGRTGI